MEAIIGLIGVVVGGLLSAVASYLASRSLEGRKVAAHRRAAARLVSQELKRDSHTLGRIHSVAALRQRGGSEPVTGGKQIPFVKQADWGTLRYDLEDHLPKVTTEVWETHQPALAEALSDPEWQAVERAYEQIGSVVRVDADLRERTEEPEWSDKLESQLKDAVEAIDKARAALDKAASRQSA